MGTRETRWRADPAAFVREALIDPETAGRSNSIRKRNDFSAKGSRLTAMDGCLFPS